MGALMLYWILFLASSYPFLSAAAYQRLSTEKTPLGGSLFSLDRSELTKRQTLPIDFVAECPTYRGCKTITNGYPESNDPEENAPPEEPMEDVSSQPKVEPVNPPGNLQCEPPPDGKYRDAHRRIVEAISMEFCNIYCASDNQDPANMPIVKLFTATKWHFHLMVDDWSVGYLRHRKVHRADDVYDFTVELVKGCTPDGTFNLWKPVGNHRCADILLSAWDQCNNKGRGGSLVAGCIRYGIVTRF